MANRCPPANRNRASVGADSLAYVSLSELVAATQVPAAKLCSACFTGEYPLELPEPEQLGKHLLEGLEAGPRERGIDVDGLAAVTSGGGAADALARP